MHIFWKVIFSKLHELNLQDFIRIVEPRIWII